MNYSFIILFLKTGGSGKWGQVPMPPQSTLNDMEIKTLATWILNGSKSGTR